MDMPGLGRLVAVCQHLGFALLTIPSSRSAPAAGTQVGELPMDPMLAAFYARWEQASFATDVAGIITSRGDDSDEGLEQDNARWRADYQSRVPMSLLLFAGEPLLAYRYAAVPELADAQGRQPVVHVDTYEPGGPFALPVASTVDRFFGAYSQFLEEMAVLLRSRERHEVDFVFPLDVPHVMAQDKRLVELIRAGRFDTVMPQDDSIRQWVTAILDFAARS